MLNWKLPCRQEGCERTDGQSCRYVDRNGQSCSTAWCPEHRMVFDGLTLCRKHVGTVRGIGADIIHRGLAPDVDNRAPSLVAWIADDIDTRMRASLLEQIRTQDDEELGEERLSLERMRDGTRVWKRSWILTDKAGTTMRVSVAVDEASPTLVTCHVNHRSIAAEVPPWITARLKGETPSAAEDLATREAYYNRLIDQIYSAIAKERGKAKGGRRLSSAAAPEDRQFWRELAARAPIPVAWRAIDVSVMLAVGAVAAVTLPLLLGPLGSLGLNGASANFVLQLIAYALLLASIGFSVFIIRGAGWRSLVGRLPHWEWWLYTVPIAVLLIDGTGIITAAVAQLGSKGAGECLALQSDFGGNTFLDSLIVITAGAVLAPIVEEVAARGFLFGWMRTEMPVWIAIVGSSLIFGAAHVPVYGWTVGVPLTALGAVLALVYQASGSLLPSILIHAAFNLYGLVQTFNGHPC